MNEPKNPVSAISSYAADFVKIVPKFCSAIQIGVMNNKNIVISMFYSEGPEQVGTLIERIVIDVNHAKQFALTLSEAVEKAHDESATSN